MDPSNLASAHRAVAERLGPRVALRSKRHGLYQNLPWSDYRLQADRAAAGLIALGVEPGDRVGLLSENRLEWLVADIAVFSAGAVDVPLHAPLVPPQVRYQFAHSGVKGAIVSNQSQAAKVLQILEDLPALEWLVSFEPVEVQGRIRSLTWDGLKQLGWHSSGPRFDAVRQREAAIQKQDLATIIYTSGTTGKPKGVMLSHGNLLSNAQATAEIGGLTPDDVTLSWLPYSHIYARTVDHYMPMVAGLVVCLAESQETLLVNLAEVQPTWMASVPRFYEKVWSKVAELPAEHRAVALRRIFGPRIRQLTSGGAPLPDPIAEGFQAAGLMLLQGYGLTETSPVISFNRLDAQKIGTVGLPIPGVEVKIAEDGEILTRGPHVMLGYWNDPEATKATIDPDGWLHTGDVGSIDSDGFLKITDRKKDILVTAGGKNVSPSELEQLLTSDPFIDQALVYGDKKPFPAALIVSEPARLEAKAAELGVKVEVEADRVTTPELIDFFTQRIDSIMQAVSQPERVKAFALLAQPFRIEEGEVTPTMKLRRRFIIDKYQPLLDGLYDSRSNAD